MPRDIESYYQEAGRAGRDGALAHCLLLFDEKDINLHEYLIRQDPENPALTDEEVEWLRKQNLARLDKMRRYVFTEACLRQYILQYFGQNAPDFCGQCGNCEASSVEKDVTTEAQKILSCAYRVKEQCDADMLCRILLGYTNQDIQSAGYDMVSTFGIMADSTRDDIMSVLDHLVSIGCLVRQDNPHPRLCLSAEAKPVLFHGKKVSIRVRVSQQEARIARESRQSAIPELAKELREWRGKTARLRGIPAFVFFSDRILEAIVQELPQDEVQLNRIVGSKSKFKQRDMQNLLDIIQRYISSHF